LITAERDAQSNSPTSAQSHPQVREGAEAEYPTTSRRRDDRIQSLMRFVREEYYMPNNPRLIGFAASSHSELFPSPRLSTCFARPFPRDLLKPRAHPLTLSPLQSSFASSPRSSPFGASFTCLGSRPSSRHHPCAATQPRRLPRRHFVPSPGFRSLSTSYSALGLAGLFHPAATSRVHPVQGLLSPRSHPSSSEGVAPRPLVRGVLTDFRRLPHAPDLGFEAFIRARPRSIQHSYSPRCTPLPSSGSSPPGPHFTRSIACYLRSPLTTFLSLRLRFRDRASSSSSASLPREAWCRVSASPACSSFRAFLQISVLVTPTHRPLPCDELVRDSPPLRAVALATSFVSRTRNDSVARIPARVSADFLTRARYLHGDFIFTTLSPKSVTQNR
jgi:hypothetical protein